MCGLLWIAAEIEQDRRKKDDFESSTYTSIHHGMRTSMFQATPLGSSVWTRGLDTKGGCDSVEPFGGNAALAFQSDYCARGVAFEEGRD